MPVKPLTEAAEYAVQRMHLPEGDASKIRETISKYTMPKNCSGILSWISYRVANFFKFFTSASDWSDAQAKLQIRSMEIMYDELRANGVLDNLKVVNRDASEKERVEMEIFRVVKGQSYLMSLVLLNRCLSYNESNEKISPSVHSRLDHNDLHTVAKEEILPWCQDIAGIKPVKV